jgi:hypothetical protein
MTTVPENWIPFISVRVASDTRAIQLQRAALPRVLDGASGRPWKMRPRTVLRDGLDSEQPRLYFNRARSPRPESSSG